MKECLFLSLLFVAFGSIVCNPDQVYVTVTKKCTRFANEESYKILDGTQVLKTSNPFSDQELRTDEYCLPATTNSQYTLRFNDKTASGGDSWSTGAWASVAGLYGNVVFKNYMVNTREENFSLSLYYPIMKTQEWKLYASASSIASDWNTVGFGDSSWTSATLGSAPAMSGTQYFRKTFTGIASMAAYEYDFNYRYGIIAYVNGKEVYRDHMADGEVTPATPAIGAFSDYEYHAVIRPSAEVTVGNNVLAVELHFPTAGENAVDFDAFVAALASSTPKTERSTCYIYPYPTTVTATKGVNPQNIFNFAKGDSFNAASTQLPTTLSFTLEGPTAFINTLRVYPGSAINNAPGSFVWEGSNDASFTPIIIIDSAKYRAGEYKLFNSFFRANAFKSYRLSISAAANAVNIISYELQPSICTLDAPQSLTFDPTSYSAFANYQNLEIRPTLLEFGDCTIQPALPAGLVLNAATCTVSGKPTVGLPSTEFTVTSVMNGQSYSGTFRLEVTACAGTLVRTWRSYGSGAGKESYSITEKATQQVVAFVDFNSGQLDQHNQGTFLCLTGTLYTIDMMSQMNYWASSSYMTVEALLHEGEYETITRVRYDANLGVPAEVTFNAQWAVAPSGTWQYKMSEVPANWLTDSTGWGTAARDAFPASTNRIQLYKKTFTVGSLEGVAGFVISLRYLYGCIIYMNGVEVFRNGVDGDLTSSSVGLNSYVDLLYRQISLPVRTMGVDATPAVNFMQQGSNTIAIAIVAQAASQTASVFDCAVRLMGDSSVSRMFRFGTTSTGMSGSYSQIANRYYGVTIYRTTCTSNYLTFTFEKDRREWLSSVMVYLQYQQVADHPRQFLLKARNNNRDAWTLLRNVTGMTWSLAGEHKKIWLENSKPYNQYRFENFGTGDAASCSWKVGGLDASSDATLITVPDLVYPTPIRVTKGIEMGEVYPNSEYFYDFAVTPALPEGLSIDPSTGKISGTCETLTDPVTYSVTAKKFAGGNAATTFVLSVTPCTGGQSLVTLVVLTDGWPSEGSYKLHGGKTADTPVISSIDKFAVKSGLNYADFCLPHSVYLVELLDSKKDGWVNPAGWWLTVDLGEMIVEMGQMPSGVASVSTLFSSLLPFQINYDTWRLFNSEAPVAENWTAVDFDDSEWSVVKAADMGNHMATTAYIRYEVQIPSLEDYHVLNVRVKYAGGVVAYFNGQLVARFNLADDFTKDTEAASVHDASVFSRFHVILSTVNAVAGKNVMAFEVHRSADQSAIVFDATGVFGVNECSIVQDSFAAIDASEVTGCAKEELLDLNPSTYGSLPNEVGSFIEWTVENLEGSKFNSFGMHTSSATTGYAFSFYSLWMGTEEYLSALALSEQATRSRVRSAWDVPAGLAGFKQFRFEVDHVASDDVSVNDFVLQYCKSEGQGFCPAVDEYPAVGEGEVSPAKCVEGFRGYLYRECHDGVLGDVKTDRCEYKVPASLAYETISMEFVMGTEVSSGKPTYENIVTEFYVQDSTPLPEGLTIDATTGEISGMLTKEMNGTVVIVRAKNPAGETTATISISTRVGVCQPEGVFEKTPVGEVAVYECSQQGNYIGTQTRACVLGKKDGEWQKTSGICMPVISVVLIVVVVIVVIVVVVFLVIRASRQKKAVGGVKGKAAKKAASSGTKAAKVWWCLFVTRFSNNRA